MLFQLPNSPGRSRQGRPVRTRHSTASRNSRLSLAVTPRSDALPGSKGATFSQTASLTTNRSRSTTAQAPPTQGLKRNQNQKGTLMSTGPSIVGFYFLVEGQPAPG